MSVLELAQTALSLAQQINNAAKENDWSTFEKLQGRYADSVNKVGIAEVPANLAADVHSILLEIKRLNDDAEHMANQHKSSLVQEKQTLSKANKMQKALDAFK